jgi:malonate-semialdehyde dehydrogenase (acetylating)/methylmalonate-semialdehyde dehydrogenase
MALPVVVVENEIADQLVSRLKHYASELTLGAAYEKGIGMGPVVNKGHQEFVLNWIETAIKEGAELVLDGRNPNVDDSLKNGYFVGPTIFDHVTEEMSCAHEEVFGPVLFIKRVENFEEGLALMNNSRFANGSVIYTQNGYYGRTFAKETHGGMVGINVGIPVPVGIFGFTGHKESFFGDLHVMGRDGFIFFTESKNVTSTWFPEDVEDQGKVDTWDGTMEAIKSR